MKPKADPDRDAAIAAGRNDALETLRVVNHIQSGLRQLCFGFSAFVPAEQRTPEFEAHLAALHEDEARHHKREAAWLTDRTYAPDNDGHVRELKHRSATGSSPRPRKARPYSSVVLVPYGGSSK